MNLDIQVDGAYSQRMEDLKHLSEQQIEFEIPVCLLSEHAVNAFKALATFLGICFSLIAVIFMDAQMAFISVTLILIASSAIIVGSEKIITLFPKKLWGDDSK